MIYLTSVYQYQTFASACLIFSLSGVFYPAYALEMVLESFFCQKKMT